jgi:Tfp pilus assembly protein PilF
LRIVYVDLAAIYAQQKDYKDEEAALQRAIESDPTQPDAHYQLGRLYQTLGNTAAAEKELSRVQEFHKKAEKQAEENLASKMATSPPALNPAETR